jgi:amino acid transporter
MSKVNQSAWMFSPKSFISLLGAEYGLMRDAGLLKRFYIISLLIMAIMLLTWVSIEYAINLLFHVVFVEVALALFFVLLFVCIYVFLLNTFAKDSRTSSGIMNTSNLIRIGFIIFMGFLIAQPLVILLYASSITPAVENYKQQLLKMHTAKVDVLIKDEVEGLVVKQKYYLGQKNRFGASIYDNGIAKINNAIKLKQDKATSFKAAAQQTIDRNSFFLFRVEKVNRGRPLVWLLTLAIVMLFLLPGYLIYTISSQHEYYQLKKAQEKKLVMDAYSVFCKHYTKMFSENVTVFSRYQDPPFNTIRKQPPIPASMTEFLQKYLGNS